VRIVRARAAESTTQAGWLTRTDATPAAALTQSFAQQSSAASSTSKPISADIFARLRSNPVRLTNLFGSI
jgi:hypothetical protein